MKHVLITGGGRGIGRACALLAAQRGMAVSFTYAGNEAAALEAAKAIDAAGGRAKAIRADASREADVLRAFDEAEGAFGPIDGFVNNAGIASPGGKLADKTAADMARLFEVNVLGAYLGAREAVRRMSTARGGHGGAIVNMSSAAVRLGGAGEAVDYAGSKAIMDTLTIGLSKEVAREGIRVNAVRPGLIETEFHALAMGRGERLAEMTPMVPMARTGSAEEVAEAVIWLLSDAASYVTGALLDVTGGR